MLRLLLFLFVFAVVDPLRADLAKPQDFDRIAKLFQTRCVNCHNDDDKKGGLTLQSVEGLHAGGDSGAVVEASQPDSSLLLTAVTRIDGKAEMPKDADPLSDEEVSAIREWVSSGANWPAGVRLDARRDAPAWWSLQPLTRPAAYPCDSQWTRNPIDVFILDKLRERNLEHGGEADRRSFARRVFLDLVGLPPAPNEVEDFEQDPTPDAVERLVDRLLASPRYGERWARHWLDVVRFAESDGFEKNLIRPNAWPYRDYVIRSFNEDRPYDRFILEQLAGDQLGVDEATGYLVGGPWDEVKSPDPVLTAQQRADELHDMVSTTGSTFLALTVGCARCHSHKFDPIPQSDYYALKACFEGVQFGERELKAPDQSARVVMADRLREELRSIERELWNLEPLALVVSENASPPRIVRSSVTRGVNVERFAPAPARFVRMTIRATTDVEPCIDEFEVFSVADDPRNVALASSGAKATASGTYPNSEIHKLEHINDGQYGNRRSWISNESGGGWVQIELPSEEVIDRVVWSRDREDPPRYDDRIATDYVIEISHDAEAWRTVASSADRRPRDSTLDKRTLDLPSGLDAKSTVRYFLLSMQREKMRREIGELTTAPLAYVGRFTDAPPTYRFHRGDPMQPREPIAPGCLSVVLGSFTLPDGASESDRRLALARWIADPRNPLTARVIVNRLWHYHFGKGIVDTPSDFGAGGGKPTHPDLLDWIALELLDCEWSVKSMQRLMVTSATYRQASENNPRGRETDADGRLLWRFPPRRMEAETLRDTMLAAAGVLDTSMGGPGFDLFEPNSNYVKVYDSKRDFGPDTFRRMVYQTKPRMQLDDTFGAFDCPDAGQIAPARGRSTTPLQALNLLNGPFVLQMCGLLAERLSRAFPDDAERQVDHAFRIILCRPPAEGEAETCKEFVAGHGLAMLCRVLFNCNEFVMIY